MKLTPANLAYLLYCASIVAAIPVKRAGTTYDGGLTANDVQNGVCAPITFIFARGSTEQGNMGSSVGPALARQLISTQGAGGVAVQGVDYPATIESNISMGSEGGPEMAQLIQKAKSSCPDTKIIISGYSQGGTVCHYAMGQAGTPADDVAAVVLYGMISSILSSHY
jgi:cutinase